MKKKLALLLAGIMCVTCLFTGCNDANPNGTGSEDASSTESGSEKDTEKKVEVTELYNKGKYEGVDLSAYITLGDYAGIITVKESDYTVTDAEIQAEIDGYRTAYGTEEEVKDRDTVQKGDVVNINYVGRINGIKFEGGSAEKYDLEIGSGTFIPGFEDGLIGAKKGATVDVKTTFPSDYKPDPDLAGKEAIFTVTINSISTIVPAEYNDAFVSEITNKVYTTVAEFDEYIKTDLKISKRGQVLQNFLVELEKKATFTDKTNELVEENYNEALKYYEEYAAMYGYTFDNFATAMGFSSADKLREAIKTDATTEIHNELLMYAYGNAMNFVLSDEAALAVLDELVLLQGAESREALLTSFGAEMVRTEAYSEAIVDMVINNYK